MMLSFQHFDKVATWSTKPGKPDKITIFEYGKTWKVQKKNIVEISQGKAGILRKGHGNVNVFCFDIVVATLCLLHLDREYYFLAD